MSEPILVVNTNPDLPLPCSEAPAWWYALPAPREEPEQTGSRLILHDLALSGCSACWIAQDCLRASLVNREQHGVWGGTGYLERRHLFSYAAAVARGDRPSRPLTVAVDQLREDLADRFPLRAEQMVAEVDGWIADRVAAGPEDDAAVDVEEVPCRAAG